MATFEYLSPGAAVWGARTQAPDYRSIRGLRAMDAGRLPDATMTRTHAGYMRQPERPWDAHAYVDEMRVIARVEWARDADPGMCEVFYADGSTDLIGSKDLLCVERPVRGAA